MHIDDFLLACLRSRKHLRRADLVDDIDGFVGQLAVTDIFRRQVDGGAQRLIRVRDIMMLFVMRLQTFEDEETPRPASAR